MHKIKDTFIHVRCTKAQKKAIQKLAADLGYTVSDAILRGLRDLSFDNDKLSI